MNVAGAVLCGGESRRMGRPKAWLPFEGECMLQRVVRILQEVVEPVVVVGGSTQALPELPSNVLLVRDREEGRGPIEGLRRALEAISGRREAAFLSSCDAPLMRPAFVRLLVSRMGPEKITLPEMDGRLHPLSSVYRISVIPDIDNAIRENELSLQELAKRTSARCIAARELRSADPHLESLLNVNTPEDYENALGRIDAP